MRVYHRRKTRLGVQNGGLWIQSLSDSAPIRIQPIPSESTNTYDAPILNMRWWEVPRNLAPGTTLLGNPSEPPRVGGLRSCCPRSILGGIYTTENENHGLLWPTHHRWTGDCKAEMGSCEWGDEEYLKIWSAELPSRLGKRNFVNLIFASEIAGLDISITHRLRLSLELCCSEIFHEIRRVQAKIDREERETGIACFEKLTLQTHARF